MAPQQILKEKIYKLENKLLKPEVRKSKEELNKLLADDFIEFGSSGIKHVKKTVVQGLPLSTPMKMTLHNFELQVLADDVVFVTYFVCKHSEENRKNKYSLRSSIWKKRDNEWQMYFHQGTPSREEVVKHEE